MKEIPDGSIDAIITDPPYGTTACKWDSVIDFNLMWLELNRIIKPNGAIVLFGSEPFSSALRMSNIKNYKYDWVWNKVTATGAFFAKKQPMRVFENILIFSKGKINYNPQLIKKDKKYIRDIKKAYNHNSEHYSGIQKLGTRAISKDMKYPNNIIKISRGSAKLTIHPTQKPIALMEYLIKTYTNENELVLDFTMGSGSTGVACVNTNRKFIGIEQDENYFKIAEKRIKETKQQTELF
tara:strand:- start:86 stop:799 length:714 start_codon:yes stop_codon:yes gene_type:complete